MLARLIFGAAAGPQGTYAIGDLEEEFRARADGRGWYWRQVMGSVGPMLRMRIRSEELPVALITGALPLLLLDRLWCVVYSMVPLKDSTERAPWFFVANLAVLAICVRLQPRVSVLTACGVAGALALSTATEPWWYVLLALAVTIVPRRLA